jgi:hypothetical protein
MHANAQAALLAQKDSVTPLLVVLVTSSINLLGDYLLIAVGNVAMHALLHLCAKCSLCDWQLPWCRDLAWGCAAPPGPPHSRRSLALQRC